MNLSYEGAWVFNALNDDITWSVRLFLVTIGIVIVDVMGDESFKFSFQETKMVFGSFCVSYYLLM